MEKAKRGTTIASNSDSETQKIGEEFAEKLKPGDIIYLYGNLGYGKTTFVKGVAKGLKITSRIISPTFVIVRKHKGKRKQENILYHIDLYRLENEKQLEDIGLREILEDKKSIKLIEWPEKMAELPRQRWNIVFELNKDNTRTISIYDYYR